VQISKQVCRRTPQYVVQIPKRPKSTFTLASSSLEESIYDAALTNAKAFDEEYGISREALQIHPFVRTHTTPIRPYPNLQYPTMPIVPDHIPYPYYGRTGQLLPPPNHIVINNEESTTALRNSGRLARDMLDLTLSLAKPGVTTSEIDRQVHDAIVSAGAYPSPLNYAGFPKSLCSSINEVICHGIPDDRPLQLGDIASFDVSLFFEGYHGDNCATLIVGGEDAMEDDDLGDEQRQLCITGQRLIQATQEALDAGISTCRNGSCLTEVGAAISNVADAYGYDSVQKYRGHGIGENFHCPPFVKHYANSDTLELSKGMVFTIEPMLTEGSENCTEWASDGWTVVSLDGGRSAQFEHMVSITEDGAEVLTVPSSAR